MNLCAFNRQSSYVSNFSQKAIHQTKLEELWNNLYLPNARLEFNSQDVSNEWLSVGLTSVQGWRTHQEDSHLVDLSYANYSNSGELALFGVFDGHNGCEVAQYASRMLPEYIQQNKHFRREQYGKAPVKDTPSSNGLIVLICSSLSGTVFPRIWPEFIGWKV